MWITFAFLITLETGFHAVKGLQNGYEFEFKVLDTSDRKINHQNGIKLCREAGFDHPGEILRGETIQKARTIIQAYFKRRG